MKKKIKKILIIGVISLATIALTGFIKPKQLKAATVDAVRYVTFNVGENETEIGVTFHSDAPENYVVYSPDNDSLNETYVKAESVPFEQAERNNQPETVWSKRYVCKAKLENLKENTKYSLIFKAFY